MSSSFIFQDEVFVNEFSSLRSNSKEAYLFLHGFPGIGTRNEDLAEYISNATGADAFLPYYRGLWKSTGEFLFSSSIRDASQLADHLIQSGKYSKLHLVGHSWGGLVALNLALAKPPWLGKMVLLSPLTQHLSESSLKEQLALFVEFQKTQGKFAGLKELTEDTEVIRQGSFPADFAAKLKTDFDTTLIIQAKNDIVVPPDQTLKFVKMISTPVSYIELEDDHWFSSRSILFKKILHWLLKGADAEAF